MSRTKIQTVAPGSPAHRAGVRPGETLAAINGHPIIDVLDYKFYPHPAGGRPGAQSLSGQGRGPGPWAGI